MNKYLLLIILSIVGNYIFSKDYKYLKFAGIDINGSIYEFSDKLIDKGYKAVEYRETSILMEGKYHNVECEVLVIGSPITKLTSGVSVIFPINERWAELRIKFNRLKKKYSRTHLFHPEEIEGESYIEESDLDQLDSTYINYKMTFSNREGYIYIKITPYKGVFVMYHDLRNAAKYMKEEQYLAKLKRKKAEQRRKTKNAKNDKNLNLTFNKEIEKTLKLGKKKKSLKSTNNKSTTKTTPKKNTKQKENTEKGNIEKDDRNLPVMKRKKKRNFR
jgi:hypothetical protein